MPLFVNLPRMKPLASCIVALFFLGSNARAAQPRIALTNAADVLALSATNALSGIPVSVQGIVTVSEASWDGRFFVQDRSGGVFVENLSSNYPLTGDEVTVSGVSFPGGYAPIITKPRWKKIGTAPLPEANAVTTDQLMSGAEDSQRIKISGIVRAAEISPDVFERVRGDVMEMELVSGGYRLRAFCPIQPGRDPQSFVGATVVLKGTAASAFNAPLRHFLTVTLYVPHLSDLVVKQPAPANLFSAPLTPLNGIAQYRKDSPPEVHVKGVVTFQRRGEDLFLEDDSGGLQVQSTQDLAVQPGDVVEAVGFPAFQNFLPVLEDAVLRKTDEPRVVLRPRSATISEIQIGLHHAEFIRLQGRLLDRFSRQIGGTPEAPEIQTLLAMQTTNFIFTVERDTVGDNGFLASIPIGSVVEFNGICLLSSGDNSVKVKPVSLLLPTSHDFTILRKPSWLTPEHLLAGLGILAMVLLVAVSWTVMVSKRNSTLKRLVKEKEATQNELQLAHDQLEVRVEERTAQLKVEMTARKESEVQFRAVLTERTRLAQELHDTLEQTMTGIALQLDLAADQFGRNSDNASHHLKLARNLMRQSQTEVRHSVWGLRSRANEEFNLVNAIAVSSRQAASGAGLEVDLETFGEARPLSEVVEENLLRISQEAITNVVKHAAATRAKIELRFNPQAVILQVTDNGKGFAQDKCAGPKDGHFGLLGISERTERLGGRVQIASSASGTSISVEIPIKPANGE